MARARMAKSHKLRKLSEADALLLAQNVQRYNRVVAIGVQYADLLEQQAADAPPKPLLDYYTREEWSLETLIAELIRYYRAKGATWADLKQATGFAMVDIKELANGSRNTGKV